MGMASAVGSLFLFAIGATGGELTLSVEEPSGVARSGWPITSGVPLAQGELGDPQAVALFTSEGREIPLQTEALVRWADGSVRWLLLDFQLDLAARQKQGLVLRHGPEIRRRAVAQPITVSAEDDGIAIETGPARVRFSSRAGRLLDATWLDRDRDGRFSESERVTGADGAGIVVTTPDGETFRSDLSPARLTVEQAGPLRACVRIEGEHGSAGGAMFRYVARVHAFRGQSAVRIHYTFINDHQDSLLARIDSLGLEFALAEAGKASSSLLDGRPASAGRIFQVDEKHYQRDGQPAGDRAAGWAAVSNGELGLAVGLREFWQNWPKSIETSAGKLSVGICPEFPKGLYDGKPLLEENKLYYHLVGGMHTFKIGVARTHELWAQWFDGPPDAGRLAVFFQAAEDPLLATCEPAYIGSTRALGDFPPADPAKYDGYDAWLDRALDAQLRRRDAVREYGMLNYGDWYGERGVNWGNLEYDLAHGLFLQYLRTGDRRFFLRAEQAARHHIDVDVVHATNPHLKNPFGGPPQIGEIWLHSCNHTGGYYDTDELPVERTYQMGHSANLGHVWVSGNLEYYFLTGDRRAWDVSLLIADRMAAHRPTATGTHIRTLGWPMILLLDAYAATGDPKYLKTVHRQWQNLKESIDWERGWVVHLASDHCLHPPGSTRKERDTIYRDQRCHGNVPFMEGLTLCALARYHRVTGAPEVLRAITVGIDQMIRECWQEDVKTFRYTACPLSTRTPYVLFVLSAEAMAYEATLTGNAEHLRILREGFRAAVPKGDGSDFGKNLAQMIHFAPYALEVLEGRVE